MEFYAPSIIRAGVNAAGVLAELEGERALLVCDREAADEVALSALHAAGLETRVLRVPIAAGMAEVENGKTALMEFKPDWVVAVGAENAINAAKLMRLFYEYPELSPAVAAKGGAPERLRLTAMAVLPLLSSSGAEATGEATLYINGMRECVLDRGLMPEVVAIDATMLAYSSEREYEKSAISTLGMAIAATSHGGSEFTYPYALQAARIIYEKTPALAGGSNRREEIANAQCLAGLAYTNSKHSAFFALRRAHVVLGAQQDAAIETAVYLPRMIRQDSGNVNYARMAADLRLPGNTQNELAESLASLVEEYSDMMGMPAKLSETGLDKNTYIKNLTRAAHVAAETGEISQEDAEALLRAAY